MLIRSADDRHFQATAAVPAIGADIDTPVHCGTDVDLPVHYGVEVAAAASLHHLRPGHVGSYHLEAGAGGWCGVLCRAGRELVGWRELVG